MVINFFESVAKEIIILSYYLKNKLVPDPMWNEQGTDGMPRRNLI